MNDGNVLKGNTTAVLAGNQALILFIFQFCFYLAIIVIRNQRLLNSTKILNNDLHNFWRPLDYIEA